MKLNNVSFSLYMNNTHEPNWPGAYLTPVEIPDIILQGVARHSGHFQVRQNAAPSSRVE